jgi:hypothetical protein
MRTIRNAAIVLCAGASLAFAADGTPSTTPGDTQHIGNEPPSSVTNTGDGAAPVGPIGASGDTIPAKYSARNAADDKLPLGAYRLKHLTEGQKQAIHRSIIRAHAPAATADNGVHPAVGDLVPSGIALNPLPDDATAQVPETKDLKYVTTRDKVVLVDPINMMVVGVLPN